MATPNASPTDVIKEVPTAAKKVLGGIGKFLIAPLRPFGEDVAELILLKEYEKKFDDGEISPETFSAVAEETAIMKKSKSQIIGDVAQVVLMAVPIGQVTKLTTLAKTAPTTAMLLKQGIFAGAKMGAAFGVAGQLSAEPEMKAGKLVGAGILGAGIGTITGAITPFLGKSITGTAQKVLPKDLPQTQAEVSQAINLIQTKAKIKEPGLEMYALSPELVFKKMGTDVWEKVGKPLLKTQDYLQQRVRIGKQFIQGLQKELKTSIFDKVLNPKKTAQTSERIFNWLNNVEKPTLTTKELSVATKMKGLFDNYADQLDAMNMKLGKPLINRRENYITNLLTTEVRDAVRAGEGQNLNQLIFSNIPKEVFDPFLLAREGKLPIQKDIWKALRTYISVTERKLAYDPVLTQVNSFLNKIKSTNPGVVEYSKWYINHILGRPSDMEMATVNTLNSFLGLFGKKDIKLAVPLESGILEMEMELPRFSVNRISPIVGKIKLMNYLSFIGSNLRTMLVNLTQPIGTAANLPGNPIRNITDMMYGYIKATTKLFSKNGWQEMADKGVLQEFTNLMETEFSARSVLSDTLMWNMRISEFMNRVASTYAGKAAFQRVAKQAGFALEEQEAILLGKELSNIVNFKYGVGQIPRMFANPIGQLYYQYSTFVLKQAELMGNMAAKLPKKGMMDSFIKAMEKGEGVDWLLTNKSPERLAFLKYWLYAGTLATGLQQTGFKIWDTFTKGFIPNQLDALPDLAKGIWEGDSDKIYTALGKMAAFPAISKGWKGFVPLRTQIQRTSQFLEAWKTGQITDADQKIIEDQITKEEAFRRFLMGTYGTAEGQQKQKTFENIVNLKKKYTDYRTEVYNVAINEKNIKKANQRVVVYNKEMVLELREILKESKIKITPTQLLTLIKQFTINPITPDSLLDEKIRRKTPSVERFLGI